MHSLMLFADPSPQKIVNFVERVVHFDALLDVVGCASFPENVRAFGGENCPLFLSTDISVSKINSYSVWGDD